MGFLREIYKNRDRNAAISDRFFVICPTTNLLHLFRTTTRQGRATGLVSFGWCSSSFLCELGLQRVSADSFRAYTYRPPPALRSFVVVIIPLTVLGVLGCCIFRNKIFYLCSLVRRGVGAIMTGTLRSAFSSDIRAEPEPSPHNGLALRGIFEKLFEYRRRPRPPLSPVQHESGSRWLHSPEKMWLWLQQRIEIARMGTFRSVSPSGLPTEPEPFP